jgi:hypothetical protein
MAYFKVQQHLPGRTEENHEKSQSGQPWFSTSVLTNWLQHLLHYFGFVQFCLMSYTIKAAHQKTTSLRLLVLPQ